MLLTQIKNCTNVPFCSVCAAIPKSNSSIILQEDSAKWCGSLQNISTQRPNRLGGDSDGARLGSGVRGKGQKPGSFLGGVGLSWSLMLISLRQG